MIFFTGCTHFGHEKIISLCNRPFANLRDHDETMISNWNETVGRNDTVYHVGDVSQGDHRLWTNRLNGTIYFIRGNHDKSYAQNEVYLWPHIMTLKHIDKVGRVVVCHYPIEEWDAWWRGSIHVHAHTHSKSLVSAPRRFNVGVDANDFCPVSLDALLDHPNSNFVAPEGMRQR